MVKKILRGCVNALAVLGTTAQWGSLIIYCLITSHITPSTTSRSPGLETLISSIYPAHHSQTPFPKMLLSSFLSEAHKSITYPMNSEFYLHLKIPPGLPTHYF